VGSLQRATVQRIIDQAAALGVDIPPEVAQYASGECGNLGALLWVQANPDRSDGGAGCCWGNVIKGAEGCTCWTPVFDVDQADPIPPSSPDEIRPRERLCGDCAFRKDSPERGDAWTEETLLALPERGDPFWCHDGMRRPVRWEHPDGRTVPGSTADWQPPRIGAVPFRADGRPALLCAGWAARVARVKP
jgi:hypothetical protein